MAEQATKDCIVCGNEIDERAIKCINCDSYQNWRRHFSFSQSLLSLFIALIAVSTPLVSAISSALRQDGPVLLATIADYQPGFVFVSAQNVGNRSGILSSRAIFVSNEDMVMMLETGKGPILVPPNDSVLVPFMTSSPDETWDPLNLDHDGECQLRFGQADGWYEENIFSPIIAKISCVDLFIIADDSRSKTDAAKVE